jgi:hypothetical protein
MAEKSATAPRPANPDYVPTVPRQLPNGWVELGCDSFIAVRDLYRIFKVK